MKNILKEFGGEIIMGLIVLAASRGLTQDKPVGSSVASSLEALRIDKCLQEKNWVPVQSIPIGADLAPHTPQDVRGQVGHLDPGQNQKAGVVREQVDVGQASLFAPANMAVATAQVTRA